MRRFEYNLIADNYQFYLQDESTEGDLSASRTRFQVWVDSIAGFSGYPLIAVVNHLPWKCSTNSLFCQYGFPSHKAGVYVQLLTTFSASAFNSGRFGIITTAE